MQYYVDQTAGTVGTGQNGLPGPEVTNDWYDADSNVVKVEDPNGNFTTYAYNGLGLQTTVTQPAITVFVATATSRTTINNFTPVTTTAYDNAGNVISVTDPASNTTQYAFDGIGRQVTVTGAISSDVKPTPTTPPGTFRA